MNIEYSGVSNRAVRVLPLNYVPTFYENVFKHSSEMGESDRKKCVVKRVASKYRYLKIKSLNFIATLG